jgi:general stress protein 26
VSDKVKVVTEELPEDCWEKKNTDPERVYEVTDVERSIISKDLKKDEYFVVLDGKIEISAEYLRKIEQWKGGQNGK